MLPIDTQQGSLEWQQYANEVSAKLVEKGLRPAAAPLDADYAMRIYYAIDNGQTTTSAMPMYGQTGGGTTSMTTGMIGSTPYSGTTYRPPTYGVTGYVPVSSTTYGRAVVIRLIDVKQSIGANIVTVYEGRAVSAGSNGNINVVMPAMIDAVFADWPGKSGATRTATTPVR
jgi:Domain of unknown function (DUF4136)